MTKLILAPPEGYHDDPLSDAIRLRLSRDENTFVLAVGPPRRGKSYSLMTLGGQVDARHDFDHTHITFIPQDYLNKIKTMRKGEFVILDEPGAEYSARRFASLANQLMSATMITMGSRLVNVGLAVPSAKMIDINAIRLAAYSLKILKAPFPKGTAILSSHSTDEYTGKPYRYRLGIASFAIPFQDNPDELKHYEEMKRQYQDDRYDEYWQRFEDEATGRDEKEKKLGPQELSEIGKRVADKPLRYSITDKKGNSKLAPLLIAKGENIKEADAKKVVVFVEKFLQDRGLRR